MPCCRGGEGKKERDSRASMHLFIHFPKMPSTVTTKFTLDLILVVFSPQGVENRLCKFFE